jgi:predicted anti-sigma-YlaC factor YlaD
MRITTTGRLLILVGLLATGACSSLGRMAVNRVGDTLGNGGTVFASDEDPDLVLEAIPFGLKTYESLLAVSPKHRALLLASASGFAAYAALLQQHGQLDATLDYAAEQRLNRRVSKLFLRSRDYALRGLALDYPELPSELRLDPPAALASVRKTAVPFLYWAGISWAGAIGSVKDDARLIAELPIAAALMTRALALDEGYDAGAIHEFFVIYEGSRPGGDLAAAQRHYQRALELNHGNRASLYVALAENVSVREQNAEQFRALLQRALAVDPDSVPAWRVANTLAIRRAAWLDTHQTDLFIDIEEN